MRKRTLRMTTRVEETVEDEYGGRETDLVAPH